MTIRSLSLAGLVAAALIGAACTDSETAKRQAFESGNRYFDEERYAEAIVEYRNAITADPRFGEARLKLAEAYALAGNARGAYAEQIRAADLLPENAEAQIKAAAYLLLTRQFEDARTRVQGVLARDPKNVQALIILGNASAGLRNIDGAIAEIQQAIEIDPSRSGSYTNLAALKLAQGDSEQARIAFEKAIEVDPNSINAWVSLAMFRWGVEDRTGAEQAFKTALALDPKHVMANRALASYYMGTGRAPEAESHLKSVAESGGDTEKIALADYYVTLRRVDDAKRALAPLARSSGPSRTTAELRLAQLAYVEKRAADAHAAVDTVIARDPANISALLLKSQWLFAEGKTQEALQRATTAVAADSESATAHHTLGTIQFAARDLEGAAKSFTEVLRLNPRASAAQLQLSRVTLARGDSASAVQLAQEAVKNAPGNPLARLNLARGLLARRQTAQAETEIEALMKQYPNASPVHALTGALRATRSDFGGARAAYERALQLDPSSIEAVNGLTLLDIAQKNVAGARTRVETHLATRPDHPGLLTIAARAYLAGNDFGGAERVLRHLVEVDPANMAGYSMLGQVYLMQQKLDAAKTEFDKRARLNPKDVPARLIMAMIFEVQRNPAEATKKYEEVLTIDSRSVIAANNLAYLFADTGGDLDRALSLAQTAVEGAPNNAAVQDTLGWVYYQKKLPDLAVRAFAQSVAKEPGNPMFHYHLGLAYVRTGDLLRGRRSFEAALKIRPDYPDAQRALKSVTG